MAQVYANREKRIRTGCQDYDIYISSLASAIIPPGNPHTPVLVPLDTDGYSTGSDNTQISGGAVNIKRSGVYSVMATYGLRHEDTVPPTGIPEEEAIDFTCEIRLSSSRPDRNNLQLAFIGRREEPPDPPPGGGPGGASDRYVTLSCVFYFEVGESLVFRVTNQIDNGVNQGLIILSLSQVIIERIY